MSIKNTRFGFTLIELMVVVSIIALLSVVILFSINKARDKGENAATIQQVQEYITAIQLSYVPNGKVFPTYGGTQAGCLAVTNTSSGPRCNFGSLINAYPQAQRDIINNYIKISPLNPPAISSTGAIFDSIRYSSDATGSLFRLDYPMKGTTNCAIGEASQFGAAVGDVIICRYVSR
jgi:prepilin-type N-terminal cleavage/methylation domain-containing protein